MHGRPGNTAGPPREPLVAAHLSGPKGDESRHPALDRPLRLDRARTPRCNHTHNPLGV